MEVTLRSDARLPPGTVAVPGRPAGAGRLRLRLGTAVTDVATVPAEREDEFQCAPDVWNRLAVPFEGLRMEMLAGADGEELELGPAVAVLYPGAGCLPWREIEARASLYFGHLKGRPGLYAIGFDKAIDWDRAAMEGCVVDNRPGSEGRVLRAAFPVPAAVRLTWSIQRDAIGRLRELTQNRTFNWLRSLNKWSFHRLLSEHPALAEHLPETQKLRSIVELAGMLARHEVAFVKHVHGTQGIQAVRIERLAEEFVVSYIVQGRMIVERLDTLEAVMATVRAVVGTGPSIVQQGIAATGLEGRALHFRILIVRDPDGGWRVALATASVAADTQLKFTNMANGAIEQDCLSALQEHYGMEPEAADRASRCMVTTCLEAAQVLSGHYDPLGILGFDVVIDLGTRRLWLLEANPVPGWHYNENMDQLLARSQTDFALSLARTLP